MSGRGGNTCVMPSTVTPLLPEPAGRPQIEDAYREPITNATIVDVDAATRAFFETAPGWLDRLMQLRHWIVGRLGFATASAERHVLPQRFEIGDKVGLFEIFDRSADEIVFGGADTHFSFRASVWLPEGTTSLQVTTIAHAHSSRGRMYLAVVKPGHRLIAPLMTKRIARGVDHS